MGFAPGYGRRPFNALPSHVSVHANLKVPINRLEWNLRNKNLNLLN